MLAEVPRCMPCHQGDPECHKYCATGCNEGCLVSEVIQRDNLSARCAPGPDKDAQVIVFAHEILKEADIAVPISRAKQLQYYPNAQGL
jgi:hypothetical protein